MIDMTPFLAFTRSLQEAIPSNFFLRRWLYRSEELQTELSRQVLLLLRYADELPESSYISYADALASALQDPALVEAEIDEIDAIKSKAQEFARHLEDRGYTDKAAIVRSAIDQASRPRQINLVAE